ncbi:hypothetical protein L6164_009040 [Bauhinia variegata]|uniref:Uncharacterized protein n=1 Tax=Bauhinia variegata TaxID=167791 RepID=A0ACB9PP66_BAUVA|nr:hypothetical protein L6164_009040 [Bauhinia variegata]
MAASSSISNFLSFLIPTKAPPACKIPASQLNLPPSSTRSQTQKFGDNLVPLVARDHHGSSASDSLSPDLASVICPSLAYANTLFFKSAYNVEVIVDENEHEERLLNRFRREVMRAGVIQESKRRRYFENKQEEKKRKSREAAKRKSRRRPQLRTSTQNMEELPRTKREEDEDNWDLPEDVPY